MAQRQKYGGRRTTGMTAVVQRVLRP